MTSLTKDLSNIGTSCHYAWEIHQVSTPLIKFRLINGFWKLSEEIFNRISDKSEHVNYLLANRDIAKRQNILFQISRFNNQFCRSLLLVFF